MTPQDLVREHALTNVSYLIEQVLGGVEAAYDLFGDEVANTEGWGGKEDPYETLRDYLRHHTDAEAAKALGEDEEDDEDAKPLTMRIKAFRLDEDDVEDDEVTELCETMDLEVNFIEVLEYWVVSDWLLRKLESRGEVTFEFCNLNIWGRTTTGQLISMDHVIEEISSEFGGMK